MPETGVRQRAVAAAATAARAAPTAIMSPHHSQHYLISADEPQSLARVIKDIRANPALKLLDTIGPPQLPHTALVSMNQEQAAQLRQRFAAVAGLSVEPDQPLSPLTGDG